MQNERPGSKSVGMKTNVGELEDVDRRSGVEESLILRSKGCIDQLSRHEIVDVGLFVEDCG